MQTLILNKEFGVALLIIAAILFGAGYTASEIQQTPTEDIEPFNQFAYKATHDVNPMMLAIIVQPLEYNLLVADHRLNNEFVEWVSEEEGSDKQLFIDYLNACENVVDDLKAGNEPDTTEMNRLYTSLTD